MPESLSIREQHNYVLQISLAITVIRNRVFSTVAQFDQGNQISLDGWNVVEYS